MANTLEYAKKYSPELDKVLAHKAKTGFMTQNDFGVSFTGADEVKIPSIEMTGAGNYDRASGFPKSTITVSRETYKLSKDRAVSFTLDAVDAEDIGVEKAVANIAGEFVRTKMVPESDAYAMQVLSGIANTKNQVLALENYANTPYKAYLDIVSKIFQTGYDEELVIFARDDFYNSLLLTPEFEKAVNVGKFEHGEISLEVSKIDGNYIVRMPDSRMYTAYDFKTGASPDDFGFEPQENASQISMLVLPKSAACKINKHETLRVHEPANNKDADAYVVNYRLHYDVLVKKSMEGTIWALID